jgi:hypothetical protein
MGLHVAPVQAQMVDMPEQDAAAGEAVAVELPFDLLGFAGAGGDLLTRTIPSFFKQAHQL